MFIYSLSWNTVQMHYFIYNIIIPCLHMLQKLHIKFYIELCLQTSGCV